MTGMDPIVGRIPVFVTQRGRHVLFGEDNTRGVAATFTVDPAHPHLVTVKTPWFTIDLNRQVMFKGLHEAYTEAEGHVTVRPYDGPDVRWFVIDLDVDNFPAAQISATWDRVATFLQFAADVLAIGYADVFEALVPRPSGSTDRETEWTPAWLRRDDGAA
jgi:hypothetical protein